MHRSGLLLLLLLLPVTLLLGATAVFGGEPRIANDLVSGLVHEDEIVRREAARGLLRYGFPAEEALAAAVREGDEDLAAAAGRVGRYLSLARALREGLLATDGPWLALETTLAEVPAPLVEDTLTLGLDGPVKLRETLAARDRARALVETFLRDWNENYVVGSEEEKRFDALQKRLRETGAAAVPHLLRVLEAAPRRTFLFTDPPPPGEISARMQVRAIFGVSFLGARAALPHLLVHARGPSLTASTNAGAAFAKLAGLEGPATGPFAQPDLETMDAWWAEHRSEFKSARRDLERALLVELRTLYAQELLRVTPKPSGGEIRVPLPPNLVSPHHRAVWLLGHVARLSGVAPPTMASSHPVEERLRALHRYAGEVAHAK